MLSVSAFFELSFQDVDCEQDWCYVGELGVHRNPERVALRDV